MWSYVILFSRLASSVGVGLGEIVGAGSSHFDDKDLGHVLVT